MSRNFASKNDFYHAFKRANFLSFQLMSKLSYSCNTIRSNNYIVTPDKETEAKQLARQLYVAWHAEENN